MPLRNPLLLLGRSGINILSAMVLLGLWLLIGWQIQTSYRDAQADAGRDTGNLTRAFAQHVSRTLSQVQQLLLEVSDRVEAGYPVDLDLMRRRVPGLDRVSKFLGILDADGRVIYSTRPGALGEDFADSDYYRRATAPGAPPYGFGKPIIGRTPLMSSIPFWVRVQDGQGRLKAVVVGDVLSEYFAGLFGVMDLDVGGVATLVDTDGTIYARSGENPSVVGQTFRNLGVVDAARKEPRGVVVGYSGVDGVRRISSYEKLEGANLIVAIGQDMETVLRSHRQMRNQMLLQGAAGTVLVLSLGLLVNVYVLRLQSSEAAARAARIEAEHASAVKSQFLAVASHELRTPLNAIIGFAEVMEVQIHGPLGSPKYMEYAGDIRSSGLHLLALINDILDLSKIEAGRMDLMVEPVDLAALVNDCVRMLQGRAGKGRVALAGDVSRPSPALKADPLKLKQVLLNLMNNAVAHTPAGGQVHVSARAIDGGWLEIQVSDTGRGMNATEIATALEPFRQVHSHLSRNREGTGLGLPVARGLVELHGGKLLIDSTPGQGTIVTLRLPVAGPMLLTRR
ncbi:sensor histidine kinase [Niveispirillum irakense]|uniref:sensor histidine kinase n=1 Tax=Niveispirillum irakense TaxID=34011 RepID=UPI00041E97F1|nr:ATP-binding protein [Niveispirillum irakense]